MKESIIKNIPDNEETPDDSWKRIATTCKETAQNILGLKKKNTKNVTTEEMQELSMKQKKLCDNIESTTDKCKRRKLISERNEILNQMKYKIKRIGKQQDGKQQDGKQQDGKRISRN